MIDELIRAVARVLRKAFPEAAVYVEGVEQGLEAPCFCICCEKPVVRRFLGKRWRCSLPVTLYCFPGGEDVRRELNGIFERLFTAMELIDCGGPLRAGSLHASISDGVGIFCAEYDFFAETGSIAETGPGVMLELKLSAGKATEE